MKFFQASDDCRIAFDCWGSGPSLLLLHGWSLDHRMWLPVIPYLSQHFHVIAMDRRGFGQSQGVADKAKDLLDIDVLLQHLRIQKIHLLGMSQGGRVAINYCLTRPHLVETLIVQGSQLDGYSPESDSAEQIPLLHYHDLVTGGKADQFRSEWLQHPLMKVPENLPQVQRQLREMVYGYQAFDLHMELEVLQQIEINAVNRLQEIDCPVLVLDSDDETTSIKRVADKLVEEIPLAQRLTLHGGGHLISMIQPQLFCEAVETFLIRSVQ